VFDTQQSLMETYKNILKNESRDPSCMSPKAKKLIFKMIQADPSSRSVKLSLAFCMVLVIIKFVIFLLNRPTVDQCLRDDFMTEGNMPSRLDLSCLTMPPRLDPRLNKGVIDVRPPLGDIKRDVN
jgi:polo-like kinase 1